MAEIPLIAFYVLRRAGEALNHQYISYENNDKIWNINISDEMPGVVALFVTISVVNMLFKMLSPSLGNSSFMAASDRH